MSMSWINTFKKRAERTYVELIMKEDLWGEGEKSVSEKTRSRRDPSLLAKCKEDSAILDALCDNLLITLMPDKERTEPWERRFERIMSISPIASTNQLSEITVVREQDYHLLTEDEFADISLKVHQAIKHNQIDETNHIRMLGRWFFALIRLRQPYSKEFYSDILKHLKEVVEQVHQGCTNYEQAKEANKYPEYIFGAIRFMKTYIQKQKNSDGWDPNLEIFSEQNLNDELLFPGLSSLFDFLKEEIEWRHQVYDENIIILEKLLRGTPDNSYFDLFHYYPDELQFSVIRFEAIETFCNHLILKEKKERRSLLRINMDSFRGKGKNLPKQFENALHWYLPIGPALPYVLGNCFSNILPQSVSIESQNEVLKMLIEVNQSLIPEDIMYVGEPEHIRTVIVGQFTKKNWQNDKVDKYNKYFPYKQCQKEMESYAQQHNIKVNSNSYSYTPEELFKTLWDHSERNSDWFYYIFFDVLVPKPPFQKGELLFLLLTFLYSREDVREKFPNYKERAFKYFYETVDSLMESESLLIYYMKLKEFMPEYSNKMEQRMKSRLEAERLFVDFFMSPKELEVTGQFKSAAKKEKFVLFCGFMKSFMRHTFYEKKEGQKECLRRFECILENLPYLKQSWMNDTISTLEGLSLLRTSVHQKLVIIKKNVPHEDIKIICNGQWDRVLMRQSFKKSRFNETQSKDLNIIRKIGSGAQGDVYLVRPTGFVLPAVAKMWPGHRFNTQLKEEIKMLLAVQSNPHVVTIHGYIVEEHEIIGLLMEYCKGGCLNKIICNPSVIYFEKEIVHWTVQAACGLKFLHLHGIVHRDVNPANMLLDEQYKHLKINDLGIAKIDRSYKSTNSHFSNRLSMDLRFYQQTKYQGTRGYIAPEIRDDNAIKYTTQVDVFSLGRSVWNMICRCDPTDELVRESLSEFSNSLQEIRKVRVSDDVWEFVVRMMLEKPDDRPSMDSVFDFFNEKEQKYEAAQYAELSTELSKSPFALEIIRL